MGSFFGCPNLNTPTLNGTPPATSEMDNPRFEDWLAGVQNQIAAENHACLPQTTNEEDIGPKYRDI